MMATEWPKPFAENAMMSDPISALCNSVMRAVVRTGCIVSDGSPRDNVAAAVAVMREELKAFLIADRYADERALAQTGGEHLAMASLVAECVRRITIPA